MGLGGVVGAVGGVVWEAGRVLTTSVMRTVGSSTDMVGRGSGAFRAQAVVGLRRAVARVRPPTHHPVPKTIV